MPKAAVNGIEIEYAADGDPKAPAFLLFMGAGEQLIMWPDSLVSALTGAGFQVIRFDYRDAGLSTKFDQAGPVDLQQLVANMMAGKPVTVPYQLSDMARDAIGLLDHLGVGQAHLAGVSLGGMVAQTVAVAHPERVASLTSIASTTGDRHLPPPNPGVVMQMFAVAPGADKAAWIEAKARAMAAMQGSKYRATDEEIHAAAKRSIERSLDPTGVTREIAASIVTPPRGEGLKQFSKPVLVIHGTDDGVISPLCGEYTAQCAPNATYVPVEGMGHGFSEALMPVWAQHMIAVAERAAHR